MTKFEKELYSELLKRRIFSEDTLERIKQEWGRSSTSFVDYLIDNKYIEEETLLVIISELTQIPFVNLKELAIEESAIRAVPVRFCWHYQFLPIKLVDRTLTVGVSNPLSIRAQDEIRLNLGFNISMFLAKKSDIIELIKIHYGLGAETVDRLVGYGKGVVEQSKERASSTIENIERMTEDASITKLVNQIILDAYKKRATDIHLEPFRGRLRLRYRIDGILFEQNVHKDMNNFIQAIFSRIKVMANLNIVEHRLPQEGRVVVKVEDQIVDLRISFLPTPHGESLVMRILPRKMVFGLEKLGFFPQDLAFLESAIKRPNGIIFVTGPTGSGKTTTLYACLEKINRVEKKIITVEDPIEYELEGITQIQVNPQVGLTFARGLRSILRHDPDVIMVGEVRDRETAEIAIRVALTGHLVLSTLHTNDAATGVTRLIDIGIEPYLIVSSVYTFIAQRLVRVICGHCKQIERDIDPQFKKEIEKVLDGDDRIVLYNGKGCEQCNYTGFYGRTAIYEILVIDRDIKRLIMEKRASSIIKEHAVKKGMRTLWQNGWLKVARGITTPSEVISICGGVRREGESREYREKFNHRIEEKGISSKVEQRVFLRVPLRIPVRILLVEKGEGEIIKIDEQMRKNIKYRDKINQKFLEEKITKRVEMAEKIDEFTTTVDFGSGGLVFESLYLFPVGTILEVKIYLPEDDTVIQCFAKVVRVERDLPRCFNIAICFLDMSSEERSKINEFVKREVSKQKSES